MISAITFEGCDCTQQRASYVRLEQSLKLDGYYHTKAYRLITCAHHLMIYSFSPIMITQDASPLGFLAGFHHGKIDIQKAFFITSGMSTLPVSNGLSRC